MTPEEFVKQLNRERLAGGWYSGNEVVNGHAIAYKGYGTWMQVYKVDGIDYSNAHNQKVKEWKQAILTPLS
jgi:hypothetical protein